jgi:hypothetical protein
LYADTPQTLYICARSRRRVAPGPSGSPPPTRLVEVVLFFEIMLVAAVVVIAWFALYALYRLITDDS